MKTKPTQVESAMPRESWWVGLSREDFYRRVKFEQPRLDESKFGASKQVTTSFSLSQMMRRGQL